ncbi:hypothetical protein ACRWAO_004729, partial [Escherichia coli]
METCFKILQLKFDKKLTNRCIGLTLHISASTVFEVLARFKASSLSWPLPADISHDTLEKLIFPPKDTFASELVMNRPGFPGECFICELRLPDHRFRWKHNKLFLLLPE